MHITPILTLVALLGSNLVHGNDYQVHPFKIDLSSSRMEALVHNTRLPTNPEYHGLGSAFGIDLDVLKSLQNTWTSDYSWDAEQAKFNRLNHFTTEIEGLTIHFIHEKSSHEDSIPLLLNHGWPGTFQDFIALIPGLTGPSTTPSGKSVSFDVIIPSLPGFTFSSAPPQNWTLQDTARVFNTLMTDVLGYKTYAAFGTDWGSAIAYTLYSNYTASMRALALDYLPFDAIPPDQLPALNITLDAFGEQGYAIYEHGLATGTGYFIEQSTEPNTIGLALYDNPVGQLAWIADKIIEWSDPRAGTNGSLITPETTLNTVSLYYLTQSFVSSVFTYAQNPQGFMTTYSKADTDAPMIFSAFQFNNQYWPPQVVAMVGNLVSYTEHDFGGHFSALDNPSGLISDLIKIGDYWKA